MSYNEATGLNKPLEWNNPMHRRCRRCKRFGAKESFKAGSFELVDGEHVRTWECKPSCAKARTDQYEVDSKTWGPNVSQRGDDPPRRVYVEKARRKKQKSAMPKALKKDLERMAASAKVTTADALSREGGSDPLALRRKPTTKKRRR